MRFIKNFLINIIKVFLGFLTKLGLLVLFIYLTLHYIDIYSYLDKNRLPTTVQTIINYSHETPPANVAKDLWAYIPTKTFPNLSFNFFGGHNTLSINENPNSRVGAVVDFGDDAGLVVYRTNYQGKESLAYCPNLRYKLCYHLP